MVTPSTLLWSMFILLAVGADAVFITVVRSKLATNPSALLLSMFLLVAAQTGSVFIGVVLSTRFLIEDQTGIHRHGYAARSVWFIFVALFMLAAFAITIPFFPYISKVAAQGFVQRVPVIAQQFTFLVPSHFPLNQRIIFEVTSRDVNHDFGIYDSYDSEGALIAQVSASSKLHPNGRVAGESAHRLMPIARLYQIASRRVQIRQLEPGSELIAPGSHT